MLTVEGIYKDGKIELLETVSEKEQSRVLVTFLEKGDLELSALGLDRNDAIELSDSFESFEDWNDPALDIYNDYDNAKSTDSR
jgi:hypothetical protein